MIRTFALCAACAAFAVPLGAQGMHMDNDTTHKVAGGGVAAGWHARTDRGQPVTDLKFGPMGDGFHATMGPAAIIWRDQDTVSGNYHVVATFTQEKPTVHREGYGLIIGGSDLAGPHQRYTYFLVGETGEILVKHRWGDSTAAVTTGWVANPAVVKPDASGKAVNELSILVASGKASFMVNGKEVYSTDAKNIDTNGIVGYRVNHNLDVHLSALGIHPAK